MTPTCPDDATLAAFGAGTLPADRRAPVSQHLLQCQACRERMRILGNATERITQPAAEGDGPLPRGSLLGRYVVRQLLGSGGMGHVYEAEDPELHRKVALKLLRAGSHNAEARARLLREAQAMARLSHPNVVPVYDVGTTETNDVFLAMERVDGVTLAEWARDPKRTWREVLRYFLFAGRGLAAAHAAGLVHRDFKPENVLVGQDGRVRVMDFGLARASELEGPGVSSGDGGPLLSPLTRDGALLGTPRYMSPEQLGGRPTDARSDQFSFCVALYEALYGERPFVAQKLAELLKAQQENQLRPPPEKTKVPPWVRKALLRGLRADPDERYPSMEALALALGRDPAQRVRRVALGAGWGLLALVALAFAVHRTADPCAHPERGLGGVWDKDAKDTLARAFAAPKKPFLADALAAVERGLTAYAAAWSEASRNACVAREAEKAPSPALELRGRCLDQRRDELGALVQVLAHADADTLALAPDAVGRLLPPGECSTPGARASVDEQLHSDEAATVRGALAQARALSWLGHFREATQRLDTLGKLAPHLAHTPLTGQVALVRGEAERLQGHDTQAEAALEEATSTAEAFGDDSLAADAWLSLGQLGADRAQPERSRRALSLCEAKLDRLGDTGSPMWAALDSARGDLELAAGRYPEAAALYRKALTVQALPSDLQANLFEDLAGVEKQQGHEGAALEDYEKAIALREKEQGTQHPGIARVLAVVGMIEHHRGEDGKARAMLERALKIDTDAFGADSLPTTMVLNNLAILEFDLGHFARALELDQKVIRIRTAALGPTHPEVATSLVNEASSLAMLQRVPEAVTALSQAAEILQKRYGDQHPKLAAIYNNLGALERDDHKPKAAVASFEKAVAIGRARLGPDHPWTCYAEVGEGQALLDLSRASAAVTPLEAAVRSEEKNGASPTDLAVARFTLAEALDAGPHQRRRAHRLAKLAREVLVKQPNPGGPSLADVDAWIAKHSGVAVRKQAQAPTAPKLPDKSRTPPR